jgi:outer membrane protein TolC
MKKGFRAIVFYIFLSIVIIKPGMIHAQQEVKSTSRMSFSLQQAQDYAYENNYDLRNSAYDVQIAKKTVRQNISIGLPQINGGADYMNYFLMPTQMIPNIFAQPPKYDELIPVQFGAPYSFTIKGSLTQLLYSGQYLVGIQTAKAYLETVKQLAIKSKLDVRDLVAENYVGLLVIQESTRILDSTYKIVSKMVDEAQKAYQSGLLEDIDVDQLVLNKSNLEAILINTKSQQILAYNLFKFILGVKEDQEIILTEDLNSFLAQINRDMLMTMPFDYNYNIDYTILKKQEKLVEWQYKLSKTAYQPTLTAFLTASTSAQRATWDFFNTSKPWFAAATFGVSLQVPIWSSGGRKYAVDQARLNFAKMKVMDEKVKTQVQLQVETAKKDFNNSFLVYQNKTAGFETALKIYEKTTKKYQMGISSSTDLNQKYNQFLQANSDYMQSIFDVVRNKIKLSKLLEKF